MDEKTARRYADECRQVADQYAKNDVSKANWRKMAEAFAAQASDRDAQEDEQSSRDNEKQAEDRPRN